MNIDQDHMASYMVFRKLMSKFSDSFSLPLIFFHFPCAHACQIRFLRWNSGIPRFFPSSPPPDLAFCAPRKKDFNLCNEMDVKGEEQSSLEATIGLPA